MNKPLVAFVAGALVAAALMLSRGASNAQEARPAQPAQVVAAIDISPIQNQLAALRAELMVLRQTVADPDGLRGEIAKATAATKAMDARLTEIAAAAKKQSESLASIVAALDPTIKWEYRCLRSRSESVCNHLGRDGWQLVTGSGDWLFFRRPLPAGAKEAE